MVFPEQTISAVSRRLLAGCALLVLSGAAYAQQITGEPGSFKFTGKINKLTFKLEPGQEAKPRP